MPYIEQYINAGSTTSNDYFLISRGNVYYKLKQSDMYAEIQALGSGVGTFSLLTDVDTTGVVTGSLITYNGTKYVDTAVADYFKNGGDTGGAARTLGNNDNYNLGFETNGTERMRILDTGEIGFGSTTDSLIDDAQFYVETTKSVTSILYQSTIGANAVLSFHGKGTGSVKHEAVSFISTLTGGTTDDYGRLVIQARYDGGMAGLFNMGQISYDNGSTLDDEMGTSFCLDGRISTATLSVADSGGYGSKTQATFNLFDISNATPAGGYGQYFEVRANGVVTAKSLPTADTGLETGSFYVASAATILANGDLVVGYKQP